MARMVSHYLGYDLNGQVVAFGQMSANSDLSSLRFIEKFLVKRPGFFQKCFGFRLNPVVEAIQLKSFANAL